MSVSEENGSEGTGERREREETAGTAAEAPCAKKTRKECRRERRQARRAAAIEVSPSHTFFTCFSLSLFRLFKPCAQQRVQEEGVVTAEMLAETTYEFVRGLRCVVPYAFTFSVHAKARWFGRALLDVWPREFGLTRAFCAAQLAAGRMRINGACAGPDAVLRAHDLVTNTVHRHEPPVVGTPVAVLAETPDLVVVNKPASLPVCPPMCTMSISLSPSHPLLHRCTRAVRSGTTRSSLSWLPSTACPTSTVCTPQHPAPQCSFSPPFHLSPVWQQRSTGWTA